MLVLVIGIKHYHTHHRILITAESNASDTRSGTSHRSYSIFMEPDCTAGFNCQHDILVAIGHPGFYQPVPFPYGNGIDPVLSRPAVCFKGCLFDNSLGSTEYDEVIIDIFLITQCFYIQISHHCIIRLYIYQVLHSPAFGSPGTLRYLVYFKPEAFTVSCKKQHGIMHCGNKEVLYEVFIAHCASFSSEPSPVLPSELCQRCPFYISHFRDGNDHFLVSIKIFRIEFFCIGYYLRPSLITIAAFYIRQFILNNLHLQLFTGKH